MTVDLFEVGTGFRSAGYCSALHQDAANRRRRKLRSAIEELDKRLSTVGESPSGGRRDLDDEPTRAEMTHWRRRLQWELDGIPNS